MSDKSFEQQVREELSDLRMKPDAAVWESVAASLKKERKRRWVLWMVFLLAGLTGSTLWWLIQNQSATQELSNRKQDQQAKNPVAQKTPLPQKHKTTLFLDTPANTTTLKINTQEPPVEKVPSHLSAFAKTKTKPVPSVSQQTMRNAAERSNEQLNTVAQAVSEDQKKEETNINSSATEKKVNTINKEAVKSEIQGSKQEQRDTSFLIGTQKLNSDSSAIVKDPEPVRLALQDSSQAKKQTIKASKWHWRVGFNAGTSGVRNSIRSLLENTNSRAYDNAFSGNAAPITGPPGGGVGTGSANNSKPVVRDAFSFGAFVELIKKMGKKEQHAIGVHAGYQLFTSRTGVGSLNTGTVQFTNVFASNDANKYYSVKDSATYRSYYHFVQLGLRYYHSLKWVRKVDLQWYGGIGVNAMLSSNGLHLGSMNTGAYLFQNRSLLRSIQMDISGGLDIGLGKSKQVYIGPQVQYMLSNLSKQPGVNQHLFRPSVRLSFLLNKRK